MTWDSIQKNNNRKEARRLSITLLYYRTLNKMSQQQLATALDFERSTYHSWEKGTNLPDPLTLMNIAHYYGITIEDLSDVSKVKLLNNKN